MAAKFNMARSSIQWRVQRLRDGAVVPAGWASPEVAGEPARSIDAVGQWIQINKGALRLLKAALKPGEERPGETLKIMAELREQLEFFLRVNRELYDLTAMAEFQRAVFDEIERQEPAVRERIVESLLRLRDRRWAIKRGILPS